MSSNSCSAADVGSTFWDLFARQADKRDDAIAVVYPNAVDRSYADLRRRAEALAQTLSNMGLRTGDRVALLARNGPWFFDLLLACARLGLVLVPINVRLSPAEVAFILQDAEPSLLFCDDTHRNARTTYAGDRRTVLDMAELEAFCATTHPARAPAPAAPSTIVMQLYTSGTTGRPKGAMITQANLIALAAEGTVHLGGFTDRDVALVCLPLFHIAAADWAVFALASGAKIVLLPEVVPDQIIDAIAAHGATKTLLVPAVIRMVVTALEQQPRDASSLRTLCFGASPMPEELIRRARAVLPSAELIHVYGLTETTGMFTYLPPDEIAAGRRLLSCGRPFPSGEVAVIDADGARLPPGEVGEVIYRGPQTMAGYWRRPQETAAAIRDGWFHTGDAGYLDQDGYLFIRDRLKDMVKSGGENVYPAEVENVILKHPAVADAAVIGLPDDFWGEAVTAVVVLRPGQSVDLADLQSFARPHLAGFKLPKRLLVRDALPRNAAGKVLKHVLRHELTDESKPMTTNQFQGVR
ncbi:MAG TPA: long-chain-fatty-acid--CoA ligase [Stellaceae bacterium]|jgi:acyl-CoA synthetase (AMP-forming)/AMP-acid ligase II